MSNIEGRSSAFKIYFINVKMYVTYDGHFNDQFFTANSFNNNI